MTEHAAPANPIIAEFLRRAASPPAAEWLHALDNMAASTWLNDQIDAALFDEADSQAIEDELVAEARRQLTVIAAAEAARLHTSAEAVNPIMEAFHGYVGTAQSPTEWLHALDRMNEGTSLNNHIHDVLLGGSYSRPKLEKLIADARRQLMVLATAAAAPADPRTHTFTVTIEADTVELAERALSERLSYDEDHGFDYLFVGWAATSPNPEG